MSVALDPCPFCACEAHIERIGDRRQSTIYRCDNCGCSLETGEEWDHGKGWNERLARTTDEWQPIKTAPENAMLLLACDDWPPSKLRGETAPVKVGGFWDGAWHVFGASWQPTHWMVLPIKEIAA